MNKFLLSACTTACVLLGISNTKAQYYSTAPISSGFNADVIANGVGDASTVTNNDVDGVSYAFVAQNYLLTATSTALTYGLPTSGSFVSAVTSTPNLSYEFASYSANNALRLAATNDAGTLTLTTPVAAYNLYILATSGSGSSTISAQINFSDGTSQTATGLALADWYNGSGYALQGIGRIKRTDSSLENGGGTNPRLYQIAVNIDAANQTKLIQSVTITKTAGTGLPNIFAFSVNQYTTCPAPTAINAPAATITSNSALVSWTAPTVAPSDGYQLYYSTSSTTPTSGTPANITNITGTSATIPNLLANTNYYVWGRSVCGGVPGPYGFSGTFKTACGAVTTMFENVDSYATGAIVPDCFVRLITGTGTASISSTTPVASGSRHLYQISSSTANSTIIVLPEFSNVNAGTNWLKFKARSNNTTGAAIQVGYVTNIADASTFVSLYSFDVTNTTYTDLAALRNFVIPNTVPSTARLAVKNTGTKTGGFFWDDITWETTPTCIEPYNPIKTSVSSSTVSLSWTAPSQVPSSYEIYFATNSANAPTATSTPQVTGLTGTSTTVLNLTSNTGYYFWIRSNCGGSQSTWVGPIYGYTGACVPTGGSSSTSYYLNNITTTAATSNIAYTASSYNAYTDNSATNITTYPGATFNYNMSVNTSTSYFYIWIDYNNDLDFDDSGETIIATTSYTSSKAGTITIPSTQAFGTYKIRFAQSDVGAITSCGPASYGNYVDYTINVQAAPSCSAPTAVTVTNFTTTTAAISWTAPSTAPSAGYEIYYSTSSTAPTASTTATQTVTTGTTATLSPLVANTTYYVWIRSNCGSGSLSAWSSPSTSFTTLCNATSVPYNLDFENVVEPALPSCTTVINAGSGNNWYTANNPGSGFTTKVLKYDYNSLYAANSWFFTQGLQLTGGVQYTIQFDYGDNTNDSYSENLKIAYGTTATVAGMTNTIIDITGINTGALTHGTYTFTPATTGVYYFGFNVHSAADQYYLYVDNINIDSSVLATAETMTKANDIKVYPNPFHDILNISDVKNLETATIVDITGRTVKTFVTPSKELNLSELSAGSYLVSLKYADGTSKVIKVIKK